MQRCTSAFLRTLALSCALAPAFATATPGQLDLGFGENGVYTLGNGGAQERVSALLPVPGGQVIGAGSIYRLRIGGGSAGNDMAAVQLREDGSLDPAFGEGGIARVNAGGDSQEAYDIVRQADGKLLLAGVLEPGSYTDFGVARLLPDGTLDPSYGNPAAGGGRTGYRTFTPSAAAINDEARAIALQSSGKAVVAGLAFVQEGNFNYRRFGLARLDVNGDLDPSFGNSGTGFTVSQSLQPQTDEYVTAIGRLADDTLPADNRILVVGYVFARNTALMRRYTADGLPDPSFGNGGTVAINDVALGGGARSGASQIDDAVILGDGRIVLVGRGGDRGFTFLRYHANGTLDTTFGNNGRMLVKVSDGSQYDEPSALTVQRNGRIIAVGDATVTVAGTPRKDFMVVRLQPNGQRDPRFGNNGVVIYPMSDEGDGAHAVRVLDTGRIVVAGEAVAGATVETGNDMAFLGLQGDPGLFSDGFED